MNSGEKQSKLMLITSMVIFGTVGLVRRNLSYDSSFISLTRGILGTIVLVLFMLLTGKKADKGAIKKYLLLLLLSGAGIGFNWILLFESYLYTSVAVATLCYYLAPILVIIGASVLFKEKLTLKKVLCTITAFAGIILVSGVLDNKGFKISELKGIVLGLSAALLYASVILMNKKMPDIKAIDKTILQLAFASIVLLPYVIMTNNMAAGFSLKDTLFLLVLGIVHTGFAYLMYFGSMEHLKTQTIAILSYIDPVLAIILSALLLKENLSIPSALGAVLILGSAYISEK